MSSSLTAKLQFIRGKEKWSFVKVADCTKYNVANTKILTDARTEMQEPRGMLLLISSSFLGA
jgi:hypothetical protein